MKRPIWLPDLFTFRIAWRDARSQYRKLFLYSSGITAGVAALVAILSFRSDVLLTVDAHAKELLGADLEIRQNEPHAGEVSAFIDSVGGTQATSIEFSSMVVYGNSGETRLSRIRAVQGGFPFYGTLKTEPAEAAHQYQDSGTALVDYPVMNQLGLSVGDTIRVGESELKISGVILEIPGEGAVFSLIGPRVIIPREIVEGTTLLERGSRVQYKTWFMFEQERDMAALTSVLRPMTHESRIRFETVESRKERFSDIVDNLAKFLGIIGFIALMLGCLGVASAIYVYIKRKSGMVATFRCLGASTRQVLSVFAIQVIALGLAGAAFGSIAGLLIQRYMPLLFSDFLPFEIIQQVSLSVLLLGFGTGVVTSLGFALLPLLSITRIPPLLTLRNIDFFPLEHVDNRTRIITGSSAGLLITAVLAILIGSLTAAILFTAGLAISFLILSTTANLLIRVLRAARLASMPYIWRQAVANLFRPNNQTVILVTTLGMGTLLTGTLYLSQDMILQRIDFHSGSGEPNLIFFDIQADQNEDILRIAGEQGAEVLRNVPVVSMRLSHLNGRTIREVREDTTSDVRRRALTREYRVTYRNQLTEAETIIEGVWIGESEGLESVTPISLQKDIAADLNASLGDTLVFDLHGIPVRTYIASVRDVDFQRPEPNFFVLFPEGVLEPAPQFFATVLRTADKTAAVDLQQYVVREHPNVAALDIGLVLESVRQFLDKVALAVQFMALFSILTGLIVLAGALSISRFQRIRESVLLRVIGAARIQIHGIQLLEYLLLGILACMTGLILSVVSSGLLAVFYFELTFIPDLRALLIIVLLVILLTLLVGLANMRGILKRKPLEILRLESN